MRARRSHRPHAWAAVAVLTALAVAAPADAALVTERRVTFTVENVNRSLAPCPTDGAQYTIVGSLVEPAVRSPRRPRAVTLYLHGATGGEFVWRDQTLPGYDHAFEMARRGHASVVIDRLGYDRSGHPPGQLTCFGGEADVTHQLVEQLRNGSYRLAGGAPPRFARVGLAGFSQGGAVSEVEAYSFGGVDALIVVGWVDGTQGFTSDTTREQGPRIGAVCASGGESAEDDGSQPSGYVYSWGTPEQAEEDLFHNTEPAIVAAYKPRINREGCGIYATFNSTQLVSLSRVGSIQTPVLLVFGEHDALFPAADREQHRRRFTGSRDVRFVTIPDAGHGLMVSRTAPLFHKRMSDWLAARGL